MLISLLEDAARGTHYISIVSLFGCFVFLLVVARPAFREAGAGALERARFERFLVGLAEASLGTALVTGFLWLWVTAAGMAGVSFGAAFSWPLFATVLGQTDFGRVWEIRFGVALLLAVFLALRRLTKRPSSWLVFAIIGGLLAAAILGSIGLAGHGNDDTGSAHVKHLTGDILHLLAAGGWLGALIPLIFVMRQPSRGQPSPGQPSLDQPSLDQPSLGSGGDWLLIAKQATVRFSTL